MHPAATRGEGDSLGIPHLERLWRRLVAHRAGGVTAPERISEWGNDITVLRGLGLGLHETIAYLYQATPSFDEFERWVLDRNGGAADQGAFTCVPGFHRRIASWLAGLPAGTDPRHQNLGALGAVPIAGRARRSDRMASRAAARKQPESRDAPTHRAVHPHGPHRPGAQPGLEVTMLADPDGNTIVVVQPQ
ncbi:MAG TPA: hypothetical protein VIW69_14810 [Candidatus Elarobacter sp.]